MCQDAYRGLKFPNTFEDWF